VYEESTYKMHESPVETTGNAFTDKMLALFTEKYVPELQERVASRTARAFYLPLDKPKQDEFLGAIRETINSVTKKDDVRKKLTALVYYSLLHKDCTARRGQAEGLHQFLSVPFSEWERQNPKDPVIRDNFNFSDNFDKEFRARFNLNGFIRNNKYYSNYVNPNPVGETPPNKENTNDDIEDLATQKGLEDSDSFDWVLRKKSPTACFLCASTAKYFDLHFETYQKASTKPARFSYETVYYDTCTGTHLHIDCFRLACKKRKFSNRVLFGFGNGDDALSGNSEEVCCTAVCVSVHWRWKLG
jgi:hypothetical protein